MLKYLLNKIFFVFLCLKKNNMLSVGKATEKILKRSPYIQEAMKEELINISSLARKVKPELENEVGKKLNDSAIIMAIKRLPPDVFSLYTTKMSAVLAELGDLLVRSDLVDYTFENSDTLFDKQIDFMKSLRQKEDVFYTVCHGVTETTIITSIKVEEELKKAFKNEKIKGSSSSLASITLKLPHQNTEVSGIYYYLMKQLAWEGINVLEVVSTTNEFSIIVALEDVDQAFSVLMGVKQTQV